MNISLTPEQEAFVRRKVDSGEFRSASDVVSAGLRLLRDQEEQEKLDSLRQEVAVGIEQADRGKLAALDAKQTLERIRAKS